MQAKEAVSRLLEQLPPDVTIEDIQYHLYVLQKIQAGQAAADAGRVIPNGEAMGELAQWLEQFGQRPPEKTSEPSSPTSPPTRRPTPEPSP